jgi:hypothetical protein
MGACHESGLCCYLVIYIETLLRPLQLFHFHLWPVYWLSFLHEMPRIRLGDGFKAGEWCGPTELYLHEPTNGSLKSPIDGMGGLFPQPCWRTVNVAEQYTVEWGVSDSQGRHTVNYGHELRGTVLARTSSNLLDQTTPGRRITEIASRWPQYLGGMTPWYQVDRMAG